MKSKELMKKVKQFSFRMKLEDLWIELQTRSKFISKSRNLKKSLKKLVLNKSRINLIATLLNTKMLKLSFWLNKMSIRSFSRNMKMRFPH